jgi:hypothetical protein
MGRYQQGMEYYPGKITERKAQTVHIQYDDGDQETTLLSAVRVLRPREP